MIILLDGREIEIYTALWRCPFTREGAESRILAQSLYLWDENMPLPSPLSIFTKGGENSVPSFPWWEKYYVPHPLEILMKEGGNCYNCISIHLWENVK